MLFPYSLAKRSAKLLIALLLFSLPLLPLHSDDELPILDVEGEEVDLSGPITSNNYQIQASDVLQVEVFQEADLNRVVRVEADGSIRLPLVGAVPVAGLTLGEATNLVSELYDRDFLVNPQINITVLEFRPRLVNVLGQVGRPGQVLIPNDRPLTLTQAISSANGMTRMGRATRVRITRILDDGERRVWTVNFDDIMQNPSSRDIVLQEGDTIFVPESIL